MAQQASVRRPLSVAGQLMAATVALGALVAAAPPAPADSPHGWDHGFRQVDLVSDIPGRAARTDPNLVNPWGLSTARRGQLWVADNGTDKATTYDGAQRGQPVRILPRVVSIPEGGAPTGIVRNDTEDFRFSGFGRTASARFIFAGEEGDLFAWSPRVSRTNAVRVAHENSDGENAVFKGVTLVDGQDRYVRNGGHDKPKLLVANFRDARIDVFDKDFKRVPSPGRFQDPNIPSDFAPFNVKVIGSRVFVTYAKQDADKEDDVPGPGNGFVNVFSTHGKLLKRFASRGVLNSPWGLEVAPHGFGRFSGDLLVGNFGDGRVNAFDPRSGHFEGALKDRQGRAIEIPGLWGLQRGTDRSGGRDAIWFAAGINDEANGLLGVLRANH
jgi:uncharacterized protein (TIGR03118 family)